MCCKCRNCKGVGVFVGGVFIGCGVVWVVVFYMGVVFLCGCTF